MLTCWFVAQSWKPPHTTPLPAVLLQWNAKRNISTTLTMMRKSRMTKTTTRWVSGFMLQRRKVWSALHLCLLRSGTFAMASAPRKKKKTSSRLLKWPLYSPQQGHGSGHRAVNKRRFAALKSTSLNGLTQPLLVSHSMCAKTPPPHPVISGVHLSAHPWVSTSSLPKELSALL